MKKITAVLLTVLALLLFTACGGGSSSDTTAVNPETPLIKFLDLKEKDGDDCNISFTYYEDGNRLTEKREYTGDKSVWQYEYEGKYSYDFNANEATETWTEYHWDNEFLDRTTIGTSIYTFDDKGVVLKIFKSSINAYVVDTIDTVDVVYTYNDLGNIETFSSIDNQDYSSLSTYDNNGNLTEESWEHGSAAYGLSTYTYDENGNMLTSESREDTSNDFWHQSSSIYTYDSNGNLIKSESTSTSSDGLTTSYSSTYDSNGNLIKSESTSTYSNGSTTSTTSIYDSNGTLRIDSILNISADSSWDKNTVTYDEYGNLIDETYENG